MTTIKYAAGTNVAKVEKDILKISNASKFTRLSIQ